MHKYRKAIVAGLAGLIGGLGVAVTVLADNDIDMSDTVAILFAAATAVGATYGVYRVPNTDE